MVVLRCYGQGVEEDEEHHQPVKPLSFHIHQTLHPEETVPATGQTAKKTNNPDYSGTYQRIFCVDLFLRSGLTSSRRCGSCLPCHIGCRCRSLHSLKAGVLKGERQHKLSIVSAQTGCCGGLIVPTFPFSVGIQDLGMSDPLHVAVQVFIQLLTLPQLLELSS